jgi:hypothetical protein
MIKDIIAVGVTIMVIGMVSNYNYSHKTMPEQLECVGAYTAMELRGEPKDYAKMFNKCTFKEMKILYKEFSRR